METFEGMSNAAYISIRELAVAVEGGILPIHTAWANMTARSNIYINSKSMRTIMDMIIGKATDDTWLAKSSFDTRRRVWVMEGKPLDKQYAQMREDSEDSMPETAGEKPTRGKKSAGTTRK